MSESLQSVFVACSWVRAVCRKCFCAVGRCTLCFWRTWNMEGGGPGVHQILLGKTHLDVVVDDEPATETFMQLSADKLWGGKKQSLEDAAWCWYASTQLQPCSLQPGSRGWHRWWKPAWRQLRLGEKTHQGTVPVSTRTTNLIWQEPCGVAGCWGSQHGGHVCLAVGSKRFWNSFATDFSRTGILALVVPRKGERSHPTQAQLLWETDVLPQFGVKIWGLEIADKAQSHGETELCSVFTQTKVPLKAVRHWVHWLKYIYINTCKNLMHCSFSSTFSLDFNFLCGVQIQSVPSQLIFKAIFLLSYLNLFKALRFFSQLWKAKTRRDRKVKDSFTVLKPLKSILEISKKALRK